MALLDQESRNIAFDEMAANKATDLEVINTTEGVA